MTPTGHAVPAAVPATEARSLAGGTGPPPTALIEAAGHGVAYGGRAVWSGADFRVGAGEFVAVLGPNGGGTTTLFRVLLGLVRPTAARCRCSAAPRRGPGHRLRAPASSRRQ